MKVLITTLGEYSPEDLNFLLPHEHVFTDLRTPDTPGYAEAEAADVSALMVPELKKIKDLGIDAVVESTPVGVGRRTDLLKVVSEDAQFPLVVPTGVYREPWIPAWVHQADEQELYRWMLRELTEGIEATGIRAGWIKLSAGDSGLTPTEIKVLRAAARAARETGAVLGSHTIKGSTVLNQLAILKNCSLAPERFIWIHTQAEEELDYHLQVAETGAWLEFDAIGSAPEDDYYIERLSTLIDRGFAEQLLVSHDRGWYDPAQPMGGEPRPMDYISDIFLPKLRRAGFSDDAIWQLMHTNPIAAFAR